MHKGKRQESNPQPQRSVLCWLGKVSFSNIRCFQLSLGFEVGLFIHHNQVNDIHMLCSLFWGTFNSRVCFPAGSTDLSLPPSTHTHTHSFYSLSNRTALVLIKPASFAILKKSSGTLAATNCFSFFWSWHWVSFRLLLCSEVIMVSLFIKLASSLQRTLRRGFFTSSM